MFFDTPHVIDYSLIALFGATVALTAHRTVAVVLPQWLGYPSLRQIRTMQPQQRHAAAEAHLQRGVHGLALLAAIAQAAPFLGLMGTCLHIITAISAMGGTTPAAVHEPVARALYATLWGLASAVPASVAFNLLTARLQLQAAKLQGPAGTTAQGATHA
jgi:biopolymer transport protein ExbB/TolQ